MNSAQSENKYLVSVIIPVYNGEKYLSDTIESVISQTEKNWEMICINDGSTDHSEAILEGYAMKYPDRIRVISVKNGGVSRARNTGVSDSRGTYIAFLDQDDLWMPRKLQLQTEQFRSDKDLGISYTNESIIDHTGSIIQEKVITFNKKIHRGFVFEHLVFENFIPISSVMIKKALFIEIGGFNPQYFLAEDFDLLLKSAIHSPIDYIDEPLLLYREHGGSSTYKKIDQITEESYSIFNTWKFRNPWLFRKHFVKCVIFRLKFFVLKIKVHFKKDC